jgi:gliding motility-associated-like protein
LPNCFKFAAKSYFYASNKIKPLTCYRLKIFKQISILYCAFCFLNAHAGQSDTVINKYSEVTGIYNKDSSKLIVNAPKIFKKGDTVIIYQAKGVDWNYDQITIKHLNFAGRFEYHTILETDTIGDTITLDRKLSISNKARYETNSLIQIVKVPSFKKYVANQTLTALPWDGTKGGIFAMIADTLDLLADINVTGQGFRGGDPSIDPSKDTLCVNSKNDPPSFQKNYYPLSAKDTAGLIGESVVVDSLPFMRGGMNIYNGGGGGLGFHSGGGGGANFGSGGQGGGEACYCFSNCHDTLAKIIANGGTSINIGLIYKNNDVRAVFGGGGGCGTGAMTDFSIGGNGGGIVLLMANVVIGNGHSIIANGQTVTNITTSGAGGGGGGGAVLLDVNEFEGSLTLSVKGGTGGSTKGNDYSGPGGGGGGGYIWYNGINAPFPINFSIASSGRTSNGTSRNATYGDVEDTASGLNMPVSNFLFNIMPPDTVICAGDVPHIFNASHPKGGSGNIYHYTWLRKSLNDASFWAMPNDTLMTYQEDSALHVTTYYLRIVKANSLYFGNIVDQSQDTLKVFVQPVIENNSIYNDTTAICSGLSMPVVRQTKPKLTGGNGIYNFQWQDSVSGNWYSALPASGFSNLDSIFKFLQNDTVHLRRYVSSGACKSNSNTFTINVLPNILNNTISDTDWVSKGNIPKPLIGQTPNGGDNSFIYEWQDSTIINNNWKIASGNATNKNYNDTVFDTTYFRRIVYSGLFNTCSSKSNVIPIYVLTALSNDSITGSDTIGASTVPQKIKGKMPSGGDGIYFYEWQEWQQNTDKLILDTTVQTLAFKPPVPLINNDTVQNAIYHFRRITLSGFHRLVFCCRDTSDTIFILVRPGIWYNSIITRDTILCYNQQPDSIKAKLPKYGDISGHYIYVWEKSIGSKIWSTAIGINDKPDYQPPVLFDTTYFRRKVVSGIDTSYSDTLKINVLPFIKNNIIDSNQYICRGLAPKLLTGHQPADGDGKNYHYQWFYSIDSVNWNQLAKDTLKDFQPDPIDTQTFYHRVVQSGYMNCCKDTSNSLKMKIHSLPVSVLANFDTSICSDITYSINIKLNGQPNFNVKYFDGYDTTVVSGISQADTTIPVKTPLLQTYYYKITSVIDGNGCFAKSMIGVDTLSVYQRPTPFAGKDTTSVCGLTISLKAKTSYGVGSWKCSVPADFSNAKNDAINQATIENNNYGTHLFTWTENNGGCIDSSSFHVTFFAQPKKYSAGEDANGPFWFYRQLNAVAPSPDSGKGTWSSPDKSIFFQDSTNHITYADSLKFGKNILIWTVINGVCIPSKDTVIITNNDLKIPQGFSPNNDGINDKFDIPGLENVKDAAELFILNKWGAEVYHNTNYQRDWDGTHNGADLPSDTYYYILRVIGRTYKGFLIIRR